MSDSQSSSAAKPKSKKLLLIIAGLLITLSGAAGGAWFAIHKQAGESPPENTRRKPMAASIFTPLESFTVNLRDAGGDHFAQIGVTLEVEDAGIETEIKARLPTLRNNILLLISSKTAEELLSPEGKQLLARQIGVRAAQSIGVRITEADALTPAAAASEGGKARAENPIKDVLFSQFLVQ